MEHYLQLVRYTAERVHQKLPSEVDVDDLYSAGLFGLMQAIDAYKLELGFKFETYCTQRVRGAIYDECEQWTGFQDLYVLVVQKLIVLASQLKWTTGEKATQDQIMDQLEVDTS